jgi:uncharacterized protein (DUF924 family)
MNTVQVTTAEEILEFWFSDRIQPYWFNSTPKLDKEIKQRFENIWLQASNNALDNWLQTAHGSLALAIVLDRFPINMYRGLAKSFQTETKAIEIAKQAIQQGFDKEIAKYKLMFLYVPLMHSESIEDQNLSVKLFSQAGLSDNLRLPNTTKHSLQNTVVFHIVIPF